VAHVGQDKRWSVGWYKDGIHPTAEGNRVLAGIIDAHLKGTCANESTQYLC